MSEPSAKRPKIQTAREAKKSRYVLLKVDDDVWWRVRRRNLTTLFLEGVLPTPLVAAVDNLQDIRRALVSGISEGELLAKVKPEDMDLLMELMRRVAVAAVVSPRLTHSEEEAKRDDDLLWVNDVDKMYLIEVWRFVIKEAGVVTMRDDEAQEFRTGESDLDASAVPVGEGVSSKTVIVDSDAGDSKTDQGGSRVQFDYH